MRLKKIYYNVLFLVSLLCVFSCTEPFSLVTKSFEDVIIVEATITDELKHQQIKVSRTFLLESDKQVFEKNAIVKIETNTNEVYNFSETQDGLYTSDIAFKAIEGLSYKLSISTSDGSSYSSNEEFLPPKAEIKNLYGELVNLNGKIGIQVLVDSNENLGDANFFRYEYEETYKIVVPFYNEYNALITNVIGSGKDIEYDIEFELKAQQGKICYSNNYSTEILLANVDGINENALTQVPIRFIPANDPVIRERYSILVKQYVQSAEAYNFYDILKELSADESLLVDNQPGFIQGNMFSLQSSSEKVIGFFNVSTVSTKRIFFDYSNFEIGLPTYIFDCDLTVLDYNIDEEPTNEKLLLYESLLFNGYKYVSHVESDNPDLKPTYTIVQSGCGDCTTFSSNIKPAFWED
ncbi:DUF4249 domain-containing protein [Flavivirga amylovorans]|uniref:DUF4249 domain-containing protein n=1 Tax=Flavivirga amylovorans TaxID=870486 RepID=A0ABT8X088_9FLAO|nr:DUF4249 domain-containing protein [Flavivirga amylovorans]MDO5987349.1 DUF4249 domain-containing protein [Flavivirga amylovorans]